MADGTPGLSWRLAKGAASWGPGSGRSPEQRRRRANPVMSDLERHARSRVPRFAYDFLEGGTGDELGALRNRHSLDQVEIMPRYGDIAAVDTTTTLFDTTYATPIGIAPTGNDGVVWPGATRILASTARDRNIPFILGTLASASIEEVAEICPEQLWFQVYGLPADDHHYTMDMVSRCQETGVKVLVLALDAPVRAIRPRDMRNGLTVPFRPGIRTAIQFLRSPPWAMAAVRTRLPMFATVARYAGPAAPLTDVAAFVQSSVRGSFSWDEIRTIRRHWVGPLVLKGIQHERDARMAIEVGADGVLVSNHGGRQSDAAPASIDALPKVVDTIGERAITLFDSGIRSGLDVARALALGADATFSGRGFLTATAALGEVGGDYFATMLAEELVIAMAQHGAHTVLEAKSMEVRHPTAWRHSEGTSGSDEAHHGSIA